MRRDEPQPLITSGVLALLFMVIVGATLDGAARVGGTLVLATVCIVFFVLAVRAAQRD